MAGKVAYAQLLNDASEIKLLESGSHAEWSIASTASDTLTLELPVRKPDVVVPVIELFLKADAGHFGRKGAKNSCNRSSDCSSMRWHLRKTVSRRIRVDTYNNPLRLCAFASKER